MFQNKIWDLNCLKLNPRVTFECHIQQYIHIYTEKRRKYRARGLTESFAFHFLLLGTSGRKGGLTSCYLAGARTSGCHCITFTQESFVSGSYTSSEERIALKKVLLQNFLLPVVTADFCILLWLAPSAPCFLRGRGLLLLFLWLLYCWVPSFFSFCRDCVGSGWGDGRAVENPSLVQGIHPCCEPRAFVFRGRWCLQPTLTSVDVFSVVCLYLNYLMLCHVYIKNIYAYFTMCLFSVDKYDSLRCALWWGFFKSI